jgi:hypothetical protein
MSAAFQGTCQMRVVTPLHVIRKLVLATSLQIAWGLFDPSAAVAEEKSNGGTKWLSVDGESGQVISEQSDRNLGPSFAPDAQKPKGAWTPTLNPVCGLNSIYLLLQLRGLDISYDSLKNDVTTTGGGASMEELQSAAQKHGVKAEVRQIAPSDLSSVQLPVIARLNIGESDGHFVVLTHVDADKTTFIDGSSLRTTIARSDAFHDEFSGYVLTTPRRWILTWTRWLLAALSVAFLLATGLRMLPPKRAK